MNILSTPEFTLEELNEFVDYVIEFHGPGGVRDQGLTRDQAIQGLNFLIEDLDKECQAYDGELDLDSHDRTCIAEMWITGEFAPQESIPNNAILSETLPNGQVNSVRVNYTTEGEKVFTKLG